MKQYIKFPSGDEIDCVIDEFSTRRGVPQCFGAVDGCHIPVMNNMLTTITGKGGVQ